MEQASKTTRHIFLTGPPGCGKSTAIHRTLDLLQGLPVSGIYTREVREDGKRSGFEMVGLRSREVSTLASIHSRSELRLRKYGIELESLERMAELELCSAPDYTASLVVLDEVGKVQLNSPKFVAIVQSLLDGDTPLLGTVAIQGDGLISSIKQRSDVEIYEVTEQNRDNLPQQLRERLSEMIDA